MSLWLKLAIVGLIAGLVAVWQFGDVDPARRWLASLSLLLYAVILLRYSQRAKPAHNSTPEQNPDGCDYLIAFATETGTARALALKTQKWLKKSGIRTSRAELNRLRDFPAPRRALLLVVSTTGSGDPPKTGNQWLDAGDLPDDFSRCHYAVLALGDRTYPNFCGFGLEVAAWLRAFGATPLFDPVLVSQEDPQSVNYWFRQLKSKGLP